MRRGLINRAGLARLGVLLLLAAVAGTAFPAFAQEGEAVGTRLRYENDAGERVPVEGAVITVDQDGTVVGSGATNADGEFELAVPGPGSYQLTLDLTTLPEGVFIRQIGRDVATVEVLEGQVGRAIFGLSTTEPSEDGSSGDTGSSGFSLRALVQLTVEGLKLGLFLAMAAIGLSLIFGTTGLVNFAHGEMIGFGMLMAYFFNFYGLAGAFGFLSGLPAPFGEGVNLVFAIDISNFDDRYVEGTTT